MKEGDGTRLMLSIPLQKVSAAIVSVNGIGMTSHYLQSHQLVGDPLTESADCDVTDVPQKMLNSDL